LGLAARSGALDEDLALLVARDHWWALQHRPGGELPAPFEHFEDLHPREARRGLALAGRLRAYLPRPFGHSAERMGGAPAVALGLLLELCLARQRHWRSRAMSDPADLADLAEPP